MDFAEYIASERMRISARKREIEKQITQLHAQDAELDGELVAIQAYENAKRGKRKIGEMRREGVIDAIRSTPGIQRAGICDRLGARTDSQKQAISGTLTALIKEGVIRREGTRSYYIN